MNSEQKKTMSLRAFTSVLITVSFALLSMTGVILFFVPPGRIANWTGWTFIGLTKSQWQAMHIWFGIIVFSMSVLHICLNWRPLVSYFKKRIGEATSRRRFGFGLNWILPLLVCAVVGWGSVAGVPPFSSLMDFGENFKEGYDEVSQKAPVPHAELLSLAKLAVEADVDFEQMQNHLLDKGIEVKSDQDILGDLAESAGFTPEYLYRIAVGEGYGSRHSGQGRQGGGPGRKSLSGFCSEEGLILEAALGRLSDAGIETTGETLLRDIAEENDMKPWDIMDILKAKQAE